MDDSEFICFVMFTWGGGYIVAVVLLLVVAAVPMAVWRWLYDLFVAPAALHARDSGMKKNTTPSIEKRLLVAKT